MRVILIVGFSFVILFIIINYVYDNFYKGEINQYYTSLTPTKVWMIIILIINLFIFIFIISYSEYLLEIITSGAGFKGRRGIKGERGEEGKKGEDEECINDCKEYTRSDGQSDILDVIEKSNRIYKEKEDCDNISINKS